MQFGHAGSCANAEAEVLYGLHQYLTGGLGAIWSCWLLCKC